MHILGLNAYHADSSAAILKDGVLVAATEEERFKRIKHWAGFPEEAIQFCLKEAGITIDQVDHIAIGRDPSAKFWKKVWFAASHPAIGISAVRNRISNRRRILSLAQEFKTIFPETDEATLQRRIHYVEHHHAHLASAFFASPFDEAALLSIDGSGDFTTTMLGIGKRNTIDVLDSIDFPHSIGIFYSAFTQYLGFPHYGDEYKIMGLAPYGQPLHLEALKEIVHLEKNGLFRLDLSFFNVTKGNVVSYDSNHIPVVDRLFSKKFIERFGPQRSSNEKLTQFHKDLASSVQVYTEQIIFHLLNGLHARTGQDSVCIAGGVAQNSVANGKITRNTPFSKVYIPSAGHDAGIAMGSAFFVHNQILRNPRIPTVRSAYTGSQFSNDQIAAMLKEQNVEFKKYENHELFELVADCLIEGGVVGWFNGRAEFGPRALGARSILADPRRSDAKELLNEKVKRRESFRPFAPSILAPFVDEYFEVNDTVPFMEKVFPIRKEKQHLLPAVTHVDGTGRLQTVEADINPRYFELISTFHRKSGVPVLLNTSFNENEPIVNSPEEALDCFRRTQMDMLVMENIVVTRNHVNS